MPGHILCFLGCFFFCFMVLYCHCDSGHINLYLLQIWHMLRVCLESMNFTHHSEKKKMVFLTRVDGGLSVPPRKLNKRLISLGDGTGARHTGRFGALSSKNLFHFSFSSPQSLRAQTPNSCGQPSHNWLENKIRRDRQAPLMDILQSP